MGTLITIIIPSILTSASIVIYILSKQVEESNNYGDEFEKVGYFSNNGGFISTYSCETKKPREAEELYQKLEWASDRGVKPNSNRTTPPLELSKTQRVQTQTIVSTKENSSND